MNENENKTLPPGVVMDTGDFEIIEEEVFENVGSVSIIIPVYNAESYLAYTIQSVLEQSYPYWELLLVNDGSTDSSPAICHEYAAQDSRIRVIHKANEGPSATRNRGLEEATGDFIVFVDSDDLIQKRTLQKMIAAITTYRTDLAICGFERFWPTWSNHARISPYSLTIFQSIRELASVYNKPHTNMFGVSIWAKMYRRSIIEEHNIRFQIDTNYEEDCLFNLDYFRHVTTTAVLRDYFYRYRQQEQSLSKGYRKNSFQFLVRGYQGRIAFLEELEMSPDPAGNIFMVVIKNTMIKIYDSNLSHREKLEEYRAVMAYDESKAVCQNALHSRSRITRMLAKAVITQNPCMAHHSLFAWRTFHNCKDIIIRVLKKVKRSLIK